MENDELLGRLDERLNNLKDHINTGFKNQNDKIEHYYHEQEKKNVVYFDFINDKAITKKELSIVGIVLGTIITGFNFLWDKIK